MNKAHVPEDLLLSFVECDVDDQLAVHIATHLDACPMCATRAASLEPLAGAFAAVEDPEVPVFLVESILREASARPGSPAAAIAVAMVLLGAAVILLAFGADPASLLVDAGRAARALPSLGTLAGSISVSVIGLALAFSLFVAASSVAFRRARQEAS